MSEVKVWLKCNMLKLNGDETDIIVFKSKHKGGTDVVVDINSKVKNFGLWGYI